MDTSVESLLRSAIASKTNISATYRNRYRELSPHALGYKRGVLHLLSYQYGGDSKSGLSPDPTENWRCMDVPGMTGIQVIGGDFQSVSSHTQRQNCIDTLIAEIEY